jgi:hypothetical protein
MFFELSPLLLALAVSIVGTSLQVWHRHGGPSWMFAVGGFFFVLGRVMIAVICASVVVYFLSAMDGMGGESLYIGGLFAAAFLAIGAWSALVVARVVYRDAFGRLQEDAARARFVAPTDGKRAQ